MEFDFGQLYRRITEKFKIWRTFEVRCELSLAELCARLNNEVPFSIDEIVRICDALDIHGREIGKYFFTPKVR